MYCSGYAACADACRPKRLHCWRSRALTPEDCIPSPRPQGRDEREARRDKQWVTEAGVGATVSTIVVQYHPASFILLAA